MRDQKALASFCEEKIACIIGQMEDSLHKHEGRTTYGPRSLITDKGSEWYGFPDPVHIVQLRILVRLGYLDKYVYAGKWRYFTYYMLTKKGQEIVDKFKKTAPN